MFDRTESGAQVKLSGRAWLAPGAALRAEAGKEPQKRHKGSQHRGF